MPKLLVPNKTKFPVIEACHYEPQINRTYQRDGRALRYLDPGISERHRL
jgi:hypothetical protein